jgi:undecaprenyl-diphosphatase
VRLAARYDALVDRVDRPTATVVWLGGWLTLLLALTIAIGVALVAAAGVEETPLDLQTLDRFFRGRTATATSVWTFVTHLGGSATVVPFLLAVAAWWGWRRRDTLALELLGGAYLGGSFLYNVAKWLVARPRPGDPYALVHQTGLAFPSGHATNAAAVGTALVLLVLAVVASRAWRVVAVVTAATLVVLVGISRLYLAAHWVTDVVGGTVLGAVWAVVLWRTLTASRGRYPEVET